MPEDALLTERRVIVSITWLSEGAEAWHNVGESGIVAMHIERVAGQGGWVPWVRVDYADGRADRYNAALLLRIEYASGVKPDA